LNRKALKHSPAAEPVMMLVGSPTGPSAIVADGQVIDGLI
jgi:hypothetical protein